jgi:hypothetical protein
LKALVVDYNTVKMGNKEMEWEGVAALTRILFHIVILVCYVELIKKET